MVFSSESPSTDMSEMFKQNEKYGSSFLFFSKAGQDMMNVESLQINRHSVMSTEATSANILLKKKVKIEK